ncbi:hypothetical protein EWM64_g275 [Hericium alpestre]|uniref:Uncharacterized protein n=1 Tax=Hericium alpestre TaxID=135208 RepID=A0A4Z0ABS0_9AGAM|nr:hypothetical protein EWM64_g275 [Hericium alpestre]
MSSVASSHLPKDSPAFADYASHAPAHAATKSLLASTWQMLDQPPPPSLREILGAYRTRGDGDREMLMAMLNAKSAEDQRLASMASLHRAIILTCAGGPAQIEWRLPPTIKCDGFIRVPITTNCQGAIACSQTPPLFRVACITIPFASPFTFIIVAPSRAISTFVPA